MAIFWGEVEEGSRPNWTRDANSHPAGGKGTEAIGATKALGASLAAVMYPKQPRSSPGTELVKEGLTTREFLSPGIY